MGSRRPIAIIAALVLLTASLAGVGARTALGAGERAPAGEVGPGEEESQTFEVQTNVRLRFPSTIKLGPKGRFSITVSNENPFPITGTAKAIIQSTVNQRRTFSAPAEGQRTVTFTLGEKVVRKVRKRGFMKARIDAVVADPAGERRLVRRDFFVE